jgi:hypothetical protein
MFCIMKGLEYMGIPFDGISGVTDWYMDFADAIIAEQDNATGGWLLPGNWEGSDQGVLNAEWALLTLELIAPPPPPTIRCRCPNFYFFAATEDGENPESQTMTIYNFGDEGCAPLEWTVSAGADWLVLSPTSGTQMRTMPGAQVDISVDISDMSAGRYFAWITVEAPGATNTPQYVPVILHIRANYGIFLWL